jgi:hypothetical protein
MSSQPIDLAGLFEAAYAALAEQRAALNALDELNHNHGDHMLAIFQVAVQAAREKDSLAGAMGRAGELLRLLPDNASAQVYARGLDCLAQQFEQRGIGLGEISSYVRRYLRQGREKVAGGEAEQRSDEEPSDELRSGELLKALLNALSAWEQAEAAASPAGDGGRSRGVDLGYLLGIGMAYLQAKQQGGDKLQVLAETIVSASPLGSVPQRKRSGLLMMETILGALK